MVRSAIKVSVKTKRAQKAVKKGYEHTQTETFTYGYPSFCENTENLACCDSVENRKSLLLEYALTLGALRVP